MEEPGTPMPQTSWLQEWKELPSEQRKGLLRCLIYLAVLVLAFIRPLISLVTYVSGTDLDSHALLVPFVTGYLIYIRRHRLPERLQSSPIIGSLLFLAGVAISAWNWHVQSSPLSWSLNDHLALMTLGFLCLVWAGGFFFLGNRWMTTAAFPALFLVFMIPMPDAMAEALEEASRAATTEVVTGLFKLTGMPYVREGYEFQLPAIKIAIARECSGIRSSWVLFITSLLASHVFLASTSRRLLLTLSVIPLGLLRNGFRVMVIAWLCVDVSPDMIDSFIHHRGGPIFFVLSLVPLILLLGWLRRGELRAAARKVTQN